jgi:hypothetical protein
MNYASLFCCIVANTPTSTRSWMGMQRCLFQNFSWNHFWGNLSSCEVAKITNFAQIEVHGNSHHIAKPLSRLSICAVGNIRQENPLLNQRKRFQWIEVGIIHKVNTIATHSKSALLVILLTMFLDINGSAFLVYPCWTGLLRLACKTHRGLSCGQVVRDVTVKSFYSPPSMFISVRRL